MNTTRLHQKSPSLPSLASELPVIDFKLGAKILDSNRQAAQAMVDALAKALPQELEKLNAAFIAGDFKQLKELAHDLKGGAHYCGTPRLQLAVTQLEQTLKIGADSMVIQTAHENLCHEIELLLTEHAKIPKDKT